MFEPKGSLLASRTYHGPCGRAGCAACCAAYCLCFFAGLLASAAVANATSRTASPNPATTNRIASLHALKRHGCAADSAADRRRCQGPRCPQVCARRSVASGGPAILGRRWRRLAGLADGDKVPPAVPPPAGRRRRHDAESGRQQALPALAIVQARRLPKTQLLGEEILWRLALAEPCRDLEPGLRPSQRQGHQLKLPAADPDRGGLAAPGHAVEAIGVGLPEVAKGSAFRIKALARRHPHTPMMNPTAPPKRAQLKGCQH